MATPTDKLFEAAREGNVDQVQALLQDKKANPTAAYNSAIRLAAENGHQSVVRTLLQSGRVDPSAVNNSAIRLAAENGHLSVVQALLQDRRVDPTAVNSSAIRLAAENGHLSVVQALLQDRRVDPAVFDSYALRTAAKHGHLEIVRALLQDGRVDPTARNSCALAESAQNGHLGVVWALLKDDRADPAVIPDPNSVLQRAAETGHVEVVARVLSTDTRVDPATDNSYALRMSVQNSHLDIAVALVQDGRSDLATIPDLYPILQWAAAIGHVEVVQTLLRDGRAEPAADNSSALSNACTNNHFNIALLLLQDGRADIRVVSPVHIRRLVGGESRFSLHKWLFPACMHESPDLLAEEEPALCVAAYCCSSFYGCKASTVTLTLYNPTHNDNQVLYDLAVAGDHARVRALGHSPQVIETILSSSRLLKLENITDKQTIQEISRIVSQAKRIENRKIRYGALIRLLFDILSVIPVAVQVAGNGFDVLVVLGFTLVGLDFIATIHTILLERHERNQPDERKVRKEEQVVVSIDADLRDNNSETSEVKQNTKITKQERPSLLQSASHFLSSQLENLGKRLDPVPPQQLPDSVRRAATVDKVMDGALACSGFVNAIMDLNGEFVSAELVFQLIVSSCLIMYPIWTTVHYFRNTRYKYNHVMLWHLCKHGSNYSIGALLSDVGCVLVWTIAVFIAVVRISGTSTIPFNAVWSTLSSLW